MRLKNLANRCEYCFQKPFSELHRHWSWWLGAEGGVLNVCYKRPCWTTVPNFSRITTWLTEHLENQIQFWLQVSMKEVQRAIFRWIIPFLINSLFFIRTSNTKAEVRLVWILSFVFTKCTERNLRGLSSHIFNFHFVSSLATRPGLIWICLDFRTFPASMFFTNLCDGSMIFADHALSSCQHRLFQIR